jgi:hypothetical protein
MGCLVKDCHFFWLEIMKPENVSGYDVLPILTVGSS